MQTWRDRMGAHAAEQERQRAERQAREAADAREKFETRFQPMPDRLKKVLRHLPREVQKQGVSLEDLRRNLAGKYRGQAAFREIAAGLRALGWERRRNWTRSGPFVALWFPPTKEPRS